MKKKVLHIIFSLGRGGAETLLVELTNRLTEFDNTILTLFDDHHFKGEIKNSKEITLSLKTWHLLFFPLIALRIRKIIKQEKIDIVHSHLYWPTVISRLAVPKKIPLVTTIHAFVSKLVDYEKWYFRLIDRFTFRMRKSAIIAVAKGAMDEYLTFQRKEPWRKYVVYTFSNPELFVGHKPAELQEGEVVKLIAVGALRYQKNYSYLINAFRHIDNTKYQLDIYGSGPLQQELLGLISSCNVNVHLKGQVSNIHEVMQGYHIYIMASHYEGFSLAVLEAMMMGMPMLLSNNPSFVEQCEDSAAYFKLDDEKSFASLLENATKDKEGLTLKAANAKERALRLYTPQQHLSQISSIYNQLLQDR